LSTLSGLTSMASRTRKAIGTFRANVSQLDVFISLIDISDLTPYRA
jgi:hypothetical protein